ncbi:MAG: division plane positioning ATPase MipZ [Pseudomonadota bacterium]
MSRLIVIGNEKGGSGKSTTAMHVITSLVRTGHSVGALDFDIRQRSLTRYLENRTDYMQRHGFDLPMPIHLKIEASHLDSRLDAEVEDQERFIDAIGHLSQRCDFIVIDCPGSHTTLSRAAHAAADVLITPLNDSLVDFDALARLDPVGGHILGPSPYSEMVWKSRQNRAASGRPSMDWVVLRNRMSTFDARNKRRVGAALTELSKRIGFRLAPGFSERVIFRELFLSGLTLLDLRADDPQAMTMSNIAARQEVRDLVKALDLPSASVAA